MDITGHRFLLAATLGAALLVQVACEPQYRPGREPARPESRSNAIPSWVLQPPLDQDITYGIGTDLRMDRNTAIAEGRRDIARQLRIVIRGDGQEDEDLEIDDEPNAPPRVTIDHLELPGITVTRQAETDHCLYVQVALNREAWATALRNRISELDRDIAAVLASHEQQPEIDLKTHPVGAAARLHQRLMPLVSAREEKLAHLQIARPGSITPQAPITLAEMRARLRRVLDRVSVDIVAAPDLEAILPQLTATCAGIGLRITPGLAKPTLRLKLTLSSMQIQVNGMERLDGTFQCLVETGEGTSLGGITINLRTSSLINTVAHDRLMRKIQVRWAEYVEKDFVDYLTRL
ncbi:MAG: hypothetical protein H0W78_00970 [Planctomycetes bacterium]|jgi:hypothetical protein|nr:hypothetical protein [Planctomycetota bacterium]